MGRRGWIGILVLVFSLSSLVHGIRIRIDGDESLFVQFRSGTDAFAPGDVKLSENDFERLQIFALDSSGEDLAEPSVDIFQLYNPIEDTTQTTPCLTLSGFVYGTSTAATVELCDPPLAEPSPVHKILSHLQGLENAILNSFAPTFLAAQSNNFNAMDTIAQFDDDGRVVGYQYVLAVKPDADLPAVYDFQSYQAVANSVFQTIRSTSQTKMYLSQPVLLFAPTDLVNMEDETPFEFSHDPSLNGTAPPDIALTSRSANVSHPSSTPQPTTVSTSTSSSTTTTTAPPSAGFLAEDEESEAHVHSHSHAHSRTHTRLHHHMRSRHHHNNNLHEAAADDEQSSLHHPHSHKKKKKHHAHGARHHGLSVLNPQGIPVVVARDEDEKNDESQSQGGDDEESFSSTRFEREREQVKHHHQLRAYPDRLGMPKSKSALLGGASFGSGGTMGGMLINCAGDLFALTNEHVIPSNDADSVCYQPAAPDWDNPGRGVLRQYNLPANQKTVTQLAPAAGVGIPANSAQAWCANHNFLVGDLVTIAGAGAAGYAIAGAAITSIPDNDHFIFQFGGAVPAAIPNIAGGTCYATVAQPASPTAPTIGKKLFGWRFPEVAGTYAWIDAAVSSIDPAQRPYVRCGIGGGIGLVTGVARPKEGDLVQKFGSRTGYTTGQVRGIEVIRAAAPGVVPLSRFLIYGDGMPSFPNTRLQAPMLEMAQPMTDVTGTEFIDEFLHGDRSLEVHLRQDSRTTKVRVATIQDFSCSSTVLVTTAAAAHNYPDQEPIWITLTQPAGYQVNVPHITTVANANQFTFPLDGCFQDSYVGGSAEMRRNLVSLFVAANQLSADLNIGAGHNIQIGEWVWLSGGAVTAPYNSAGGFLVTGTGAATITISFTVAVADPAGALLAAAAGWGAQVIKALPLKGAQSTNMAVTVNTNANHNFGTVNRVSLTGLSVAGLNLKDGKPIAVGGGKQFTFSPAKVLHRGGMAGGASPVVTPGFTAQPVADRALATVGCSYVETTFPLGGAVPADILPLSYITVNVAGNADYTGTFQVLRNVGNNIVFKNPNCPLAAPAPPPAPMNLVGPVNARITKAGVALTAVAVNGRTVTFTTSTPHRFAAGVTVTVSNVNYNFLTGDYTNVVPLTATTFTGQLGRIASAYVYTLRGYYPVGPSDATQPMLALLTRTGANGAPAVVNANAALNSANGVATARVANGNLASGDVVYVSSTAVDALDTPLGAIITVSPADPLVFTYLMPSYPTQRNSASVSHRYRRFGETVVIGAFVVAGGRARLTLNAALSALPNDYVKIDGIPANSVGWAGTFQLHSISGNRLTIEYALSAAGAAAPLPSVAGATGFAMSIFDPQNVQCRVRAAVNVVRCTFPANHGLQIGDRLRFGAYPMSPGMQPIGEGVTVPITLPSATEVDFARPGTYPANGVGPFGLTDVYPTHVRADLDSVYPHLAAHNLISVFGYWGDSGSFVMRGTVGVGLFYEAYWTVDHSEVKRVYTLGREWPMHRIYGSSLILQEQVDELNRQFGNAGAFEVCTTQNNPEPRNDRACRLTNNVCMPKFFCQANGRGGCQRVPGYPGLV